MNETKDTTLHFIPGDIVSFNGIELAFLSAGSVIVTHPKDMDVTTFMGMPKGAAE